ncbi:carotenoid biosynthesis protein [Legionella dresdenensis]|uniref:Carotenoid biosynthesis protein n=1 Tax=Legionella dresdenensis TaxID=450200 RepID=A0ABV8CHZ2_9GAMM
MKTQVDANKSFSITHWMIISVYLLVTILAAFWTTPTATRIIPILCILSIFIIVWLHGLIRFGMRNMLFFFLITWAISHFFEALSIQTGYPFGNYFYDVLTGPRLFQVPLIIMLAYFGMGYASWMLATILLRQFNQPLKGCSIFTVPFIAAFIMTMWDLCMDPIASTVASLWVWKDGGAYFGVPLQNYFGWFFVVYLIYQIYALYIARFDRTVPAKQQVMATSCYWYEIVAVYSIQALTQLLQPFGNSVQPNIFASMALVCIFTMIFVSILALFTIKNVWQK